MGADDQREFIDFYGFHTDDWPETFGTFSGHKYLLEREYISNGCSTEATSEASITHEFLYPHHIKKTYYIEGVVQGHIVLIASGCTSTITSYRVSVCKTYESASQTNDVLDTTGWITVNDTLAWDAGLSVGDEMVYPFWIDVWEERKFTDKQRMFIRIEVKCNSCTHLGHANDKTWEDVWISIPFRL